MIVADLFAGVGGFRVGLNKIKNIDISISHCKEYAVATVVAMVEE